MAVDDVAVSVSQDTFQLLVLLHHVGGQELTDVFTVIVEACCCVEQVVEPILPKAGKDQTTVECAGSIVLSKGSLFFSFFFRSDS